MRWIWPLSIALAVAALPLACDKTPELDESEKAALPDELDPASTCAYAIDEQGRKQDLAECEAEVASLIEGCDGADETLRCLAASTSPKEWRGCSETCAPLVADAGDADADVPTAAAAADAPTPTAADAPTAAAADAPDADPASADTEADPPSAEPEADAAPKRPVLEIVAGGDTTCARFADGRVGCWGGASGGSIPGASGASASSPQILSIEGVTALAMAGAVRGPKLGLDHYGGYDMKPYKWRAPTRDAAGYTAIGCAQVDGAQWQCWGEGAALDPGVDTASGPRHVPAFDGFETLALGLEMGCGLKAGVVSCWGNADALLGRAVEGEGWQSPAPVAGIEGAVTVGGVDARPCVVLGTGSAQCWGAPDDPLAVRDVPNLVEITGVPGGAAVTCFQTSYTIECMHEESGVKNEVRGARTLTATSAGDHTFCGIDEDGTPSCWGSGVFGQIPGHDDPLASLNFVNGIPGKSIDIAVGYGHACALTEAGEVWCWGQNDRGQLGDGTSDAAEKPVQVTGLPTE